MPLIDLERNTAADALAGRITHFSLHTATPGTTGASESTAVRKAAAWTAAANGTAIAAEVTFDVSTGTYSHFGAWNALSGGTFRGGNALATSQTFTEAGQLKLIVTIPVTAS